MASEKITALIEEVKGLTVLELSELVHALEEEFGVSAAAMAAPAAAAAAPASTDAFTAATSPVTVIVTSPPFTKVLSSSLTSAAFSIASAASIDGTSPYVSIIPNASICLPP